MIKRYNDYSFFDDQTFEKLAKVVNDESKVVNIVEDMKQASILRKQLIMQGYNARIEKHASAYHVIAVPRDMIPLYEAMESGQFKRVAFGRYSFTNVANNKLGIEHYNFDEGTIWKVMKGKNGKEYLVKEVEDDNEDNVIRNSEKVVTATNQLDGEKLKKVCKALYNNTSDELITDLVDALPGNFNKIVNAKLSNVIESEMKQKSITSPEYIAEVREKVIDSINKDIIFNRKQIYKLISAACNKYKQRLGE